MVKFIQAIQIQSDSSLVYKNTKLNITQPTVVQASNLNEQLGHIHQIFSDKTGTLTCNDMEFSEISIKGINYGSQFVSQKDIIHPEDLREYSINYNVEHVKFYDKRLFQQFNKDHNVTQSVLFLALCHTIVAEPQTDGSLKYNSSSPDELAFVNFAKMVGYEYLEQKVDIINIKNTKTNSILQFQLLEVFQFNSDRKRQSVLVKNLQNQKIHLITKGADNIMLPRCQKTQNSEIQQVKDAIQQYSKVGLRTLIFAYKDITQNALNDFQSQYQKAKTSILNRQEKMQVLQDEIEKNLQLVCATAIEDRLQDKVPETLKFFQETGIKVWMLTGDKLETAINIGFASQLLQKQYKIQKITVDQTLDEQQQILKVKEQLDQTLTKIQQSQKDDIFSLVVNGDALFKVTTNKESIKIFLQVTQQCKSIIVCRVTPSQKQQVVSLVRKNNKKQVTLAIGDGANDVQMITAAHVGIGIKGVEGQQAVRASDFVIGEFKILRPLMYIHGRESYRRNSILVLYNFYKNFILVFPQIYLSYYNNFSGNTPYDMFLHQFFNILYSFLPILVYAMFERDKKNYRSKLYYNINQSYQEGQNSQYFNLRSFGDWFFQGLLHSFIIFFVAVKCQENILQNTGHITDFYQLGCLIYTLNVVVVNIKCFTFFQSYNLGAILSLIGSIGVYYLSLFLSNILPFSQYYTITGELFSTKYVYLNILAVVSFILAWEYMRFCKKIVNLNSYKKITQSENIDMIRGSL